MTSPCLFAQYSYIQKEAQERTKQQIAQGLEVTDDDSSSMITGEVMGVNKKKQRFTVMDKSRWNATQAFITDDETAFIGFESLGDLNMGDLVSVTYLSYDGSDKTADSIVLKERAPDGYGNPPAAAAQPEETLEKVLGGR